ncbi:MAG: hypothetical protein ACYCYK_05550 [Candidatus Dormibacteria bacterium]
MPVLGDHATDWPHRVSGTEEFDQAMHHLTRRLAAGPRITLVRTQRLSTLTLTQALHREVIAPTLTVSAPAFSEGLVAFSQRRKPVFC